ncbi:MAG: sugar transferase [Wujia sp.]
MINKFTSRGKHIDFILIDLFCVVFTFFLATKIRFYNQEDQYIVEEYYAMAAIIILAHLFIVFFSENYSGIMRRDALKELKAVIFQNFEFFAVTFVMEFFIRNTDQYSRLMMVLYIILDTLVMYVLRCLRKHELYKKSASPKGKSMMLVVADSEHIAGIIRNFKDMKFKNFWVNAAVVFDKEMTGELVEKVPVVANLETMYDYVRTNVVDEVFLEYRGKHVHDIVNRFLSMGVVVHMSLTDIMPDAPKTTIQKISDYRVATASINFMSFKQIFVKRLMDICIAIPGVIMTGILFIIFAPIIYIQSPGPIFFKQTRVGRNGRTFKLYKFRSMYMDAEERKKELMDQNKMNGLMFKMDDDPRITPIGKFIRKTSIDEFPQFFNILKGDMSFVGTRPPTLDEYEKYELHHKSRLAIKPGLTGMWQVSGRSDITDFEEVVKLDNQYIKSFCLSLDVKIILKTVTTVLKRKGSV